MKQRILSFFRKYRYKVKENIKWYKDYFFLRHSMSFYRNVRVVFALLKFSVLVFSLTYILFSSEMVLMTENHVPYFNRNFITGYVDESGVLSIQITLTLISVSLIALISNIENKYVYGERILDLAFPSKFLSFKIIMLGFFGLLLCNVGLMMQNCSFVYSMIILLLSLYLAIFVLYRFATIFLSRDSLCKELFYKYYKSNLVYMKKVRPIEPYVSDGLQKLKVITLKHISNKNYPELNEYILLYFNLLKITLFNKPKQVQEYYTEYTNFQDIIGHINEFSLAMLHENKALFGLQMYNTLLRHINYYKVVCVNEIAFTSNSFIEAFSDLKDIIQIKRYLNELMYMTGMLMQQTYLYSTADLSYCRLSKSKNLIHYMARRNMYEEIYDLIIQSSKLSDSEKSDMIETIRLNIIGHTVYSHGQDIDDFRRKERFHRKERIYSLDIKGEPIALLFIRFIEQNDFEHFIDYRFVWNNYNQEDKSVCFALILSMLCVVNNLHHKGKREYLDDIKIGSENVKGLFKKYNLLDIKINNSDLNDYYAFITENYSTNNQKVDGCKKAYDFHPKLIFDQNIIDMLFAYLYWKNQNEYTLQKIADVYNLIYTKEIGEIISELCSGSIEVVSN